MSININHVTNVLSANTGIISISGNTGFKNRIINGRFAIWQLGTGTWTITAGNTSPAASGLGFTVDRWFTYCLGANVTLSNTNVNSIPGAITITGAASVTEVGLGQRIETLHSQDLAGSTVTLSWFMSSSTLTSISIVISYANTSNTFGTIGTPTKTTISTVSTTITSSFSGYKYTFAMPSAATTGVEILFKTGAFTSGNLSIGYVQLEQGGSNTAYDNRSYTDELQLCQRYLEVSNGNGLISESGYCAAAGTVYAYFPMNVTKFSAVATTSLANGYTATNVTSVGLASNTLRQCYLFQVTTTAAGFWSLVNKAPIIIIAEIP